MGPAAGSTHTLAPEQLGPFTDLSIVNELDVAEQDPAFRTRHGDYFRGLFATRAPLASPAVLAEARRILVMAGRRRGPPAIIEVMGTAASSSTTAFSCSTWPARPTCSRPRR